MSQSNTKNPMTLDEANALFDRLSNMNPSMVPVTNRDDITGYKTSFWENFYKAIETRVLAKVQAEATNNLFHHRPMTEKVAESLRDPSPQGFPAPEESKSGAGGDGKITLDVASLETCYDSRNPRPGEVHPTIKPILDSIMPLEKKESLERAIDGFIDDKSNKEKR